MHGQPEQPPQQRQIRVFISSTFRDMHAEREELVKQVFPQLRKLCEQRGVVWSDVDLRWGVTDEQKAEGYALPICLAEIERCRPYFIGLLGERYGPPVDKIHSDVLAREPWLNDHLEHSLTEMEVLHGVLRNPVMAEHAFFYFRDPAYLDRLPESANPSDFRSQNADQAERLRQLKARIRLSGFPVRENYSDPKALGQLLLADFTALIDRLYPEGSQPSPLEREAMDHDFYAASREPAYIRRQADFDALDRHVAGQGKPLVVLGESGVGKSALLANWALDWRKRNPETPLLLHFIGSTPDSADWARMVRRILGELQRRFSLELEMPDQPDPLRAVFANALHMVAAHGRVVLVLDALNQLEDHDGAPDLVWLPPVVPAKVRLIVSTLPGRPLDELNKRGWPSLTVEPLRVEERRKLIADYLAQHAKGLSPHRAERIAAAEQTANPLYLRALLEELRVFGGHDLLDQRIEHYLEAGNVPDLFDRILARWEEDYEGDYPGLVGRALSLIWAARRGLSEGELLDLLGTGSGPIPRAWWSPLSLAAEASLMNRSGLIGFAHEFVRTAAEKRYTPGPRIHLNLAYYFAGSEIAEASPRMLDELPWHLARAERWRELVEILTAPPLLLAINMLSPYDVREYWALIEKNSNNRMVVEYRSVIRGSVDEIEKAAYLPILINLLFDFGHGTEAGILADEAIRFAKSKGNLRVLQSFLSLRGMVCSETGDYGRAMEIFREQSEICRRLKDTRGLIAALNGQATLLHRRRSEGGALALLKHAEQLAIESSDRRSLAICYANQALVLRNCGDPEGALKLHRLEERLCQGFGDKDGIGRSFGNQALALMEGGDLAGALSIAKRQEGICRLLGQNERLVACLGNQASILCKLGKLVDAQIICEEAVLVSRQMGNSALIAKALINQGVILRKRQLDDRADLAFREARRLALDNTLADVLACMRGMAEEGDL